MAEHDQGNPSLNGDTVLEVSVRDLENNPELVVLSKEGDKNENEIVQREVSINGSNSVNSTSDETRNDRRAVTTCDINKPAETMSDNRRANFNARGIHEKSGSNTYVVSGDSDDDQNAQCMTIYRGEVIDVSDNSDSSDSETSSTVSDDNEDSDNASIRSSSDKSDTEINKTGRVTRTRGELSLQDLPPIEDLKISVDENKCKPIGSVLNIVDEMVVIQSFPNTPPLDIDTVLFLDRGQRALGKIFDVFGPVQEPFYSVRFNSREHVQEKDIRREQVVYCAPQTEYTSYISVAQLLKEKGSDASWTHNNEPPETCLDFSDDEAEARHKRPKVSTGSKRDNPSTNDQFVKQMNQKNLELTAKRRKEDEAKQKRGSALRQVMNCPGGPVGENLISAAAAHPFGPFAKSRTYSNSSAGDQACSTSFFHHPAASAVMVNTRSSPPSKFESAPAPRAMNYLRNAAAAAAAAAVSYTPPPPLNYTFPTPQHFMCSSPRQLPSQPQPPSTAAAAVAAAQNYLAMYHHQRTPTGPSAVATTALSMVVPPPFSHFTAASIPAMPTFVTQPPAHQGQPQQQAALHPAMPPSFYASVPPPFAGFNAMPTPPLPSSLPQPNFFAARTDGGSAPVHHQATFIPLSMRPAVPPAFHPQFVLPPPPPPPPGTVPLAQSPQQQHQRDVSAGPRMPDRRIQQSTHQTTNTFYPSSPSNS